jgi:gas vesicle protein
MGAVVVIAALAAMVVAVTIVDSVWLRAVLVLIPALVIATGALAGAHASDERDRIDERRTNLTLRERIQELLDLIRDFYTTCHMVAVGQLEPSKAKAKAQAVERRLSEIMAEMLETAEKAQP